MKANILMAEMTREQIRAVAPGSTVVLPLASTEQHGPHLPITTDTLVCTTICQRAAASAAEKVPIVVAPILPYGLSQHHRPYPGVLSLSTATYMLALREVCESLAQSGFPRIVMINGHGGNDLVARQVAADMSLSLPVSVAAAGYWIIAESWLLKEAQALGLGNVPGHAGAFETALVLALRPDLVDTTSYPPAVAHPDVARQIGQKMSVIGRGQNIGAGPGYSDDPASATPEMGQRLLDAIVRDVASFLIDFSTT